MTTTELLATLKAKDIRLLASGDSLKVDAPDAALTPELVETIKTHKMELLRMLRLEPIGCAWREDERGRLIFSDGAIYASTTTGGFIMVKHPKRRMIAPGAFAVDEEAGQ